MIEIKKSITHVVNDVSKSIEASVCIDVKTLSDIDMEMVSMIIDKELEEKADGHNS